MKKDILHLRAPGNWLNDPNGFIYYGGKYHLFYQHFPYAPVWGTMHWGHAVSEDLVHWEHLDVALFPTKEYDQNGIYSGSALEVEGKLYLYYSAVRYLEKDDENIHMAINDRYETSQALLVSDDGYHFDNWKRKRQVIPVNREDARAHPTHTRDPKVWKEKDRYYMVLGSTFREETGRVVFYTSRDGVAWEFASQMKDQRLGRIVECPDIFKSGDGFIFMGSSMYVCGRECGYEHHAVCATASFEPEGCKLTISGECRFVDYGLDLYAPQTNVDRDGRRVMIAWMRMPKAVKGDDGREWNGMMCQPRVVESENGHIYFRVHPEVRAYFNRQISSPDKHDFSKPFCLKLPMTEEKSVNIGGYRIWMENGTVVADRSSVFAGITEYPLTARSPKVSGQCDLEVFVDKNLVEIFINSGAYVISHVVYGIASFFESEGYGEGEISFYCHTANPPVYPQHDDR